MEELSMFERIRKAYGCEKRKLAGKIGVSYEQIYRWKTKGWSKSTEKIFDFLLKKIEELENKP